MNKVQEMLRTISQTKDSLERIECNYEGAPKGTIYRESVRHHKKKIEDTVIKLKAFGGGLINEWQVTGVTQLSQGRTSWSQTKTVLLDSSITEEEIIDRYRISGFNIDRILRTKQFKLGDFPSINEFSQ